MDKITSETVTLNMIWSGETRLQEKAGERRIQKGVTQG